PHGLRLIPYGLLVWPPRPDQPLVEVVERKFAHSERFVLPRMTAPPARRLAATVESVDAGAPAKPNEPAVVCMRSRVPLSSFPTSGTPGSGPRTLPCLRIWSAWRAIDSTSGLSSITELTPSVP